VKSCDLPCNGAAEREGYRFWLPEARPKSPVNTYRACSGRFIDSYALGQRRHIEAQLLLSAWTRTESVPRRCTPQPVPLCGHFGLVVIGSILRLCANCGRNNTVRNASITGTTLGQFQSAVATEPGIAIQ